MPTTKTSTTSGLEEEKINLKGTIENVTKELDSISKITKNIEDTYTKRLGSVDPSASETKEMILAGLNTYLEDKNYNSIAVRLKELRFQSKNPYFARIKFIPQSGNTIHDLYIGRHTFLQNSPYKSIVDWRSPIASLYYNYLGANPHVTYAFSIYDKPSKKYIKNEIKGRLELRRRIEIEDGKLLKIHDTSDDIDVLVDILEDKTGGVLETIIESIQAEQNEIIRTDLDTPMIIQGVAGSGKTTIAIHKISYLIYTYNTLINEKNILLLLNSPVLTKYIKTTLSDLEIDDPLIRSLRQVLTNKLERFNDGYKIKFYDVEKTDTTIDSKKLLEDINEYCLNYSKDIYIKVSKISGAGNFAVSDITNEDKIYEKTNQLIKDFEKQIKTLIDMEDVEEEDKRIINLDSKIERLRGILKDFKLTETFEGFLNEYQYKLSKTDDTYLQSMYIFAHELWGDFIPGGKYNYTLVDEGQDYTELEFETIVRITHNGRISIFADVNQSTTSRGVNKNWNSISEIFKKHSNNPVKFHNLTTSYRNTKQITDLNRNILNKFEEGDPDFLPVAYNRNGLEPEINKSENREALLKKLEKDLTLMQKTNFKSACIVELDKSKIENTKKYLTDLGIETVQIDKSLKEFEIEKIYICTEEDVKGLEFSSIFVIDPSSQILPYNQISAKRLYILCSRAINLLNIYAIKDINKLLIES